MLNNREKVRRGAGRDKERGEAKGSRKLGRKRGRTELERRVGSEGMEMTLREPKSRAGDTTVTSNQREKRRN